jgi:phosphohistidine phosphatase SixA
MNIYLLQFSAVELPSGDGDELLTAIERSNVVALSKRAAELKIRVDQVFHSGGGREQQAAEILANCLGEARLVERMEGLGPNVRMAETAAWLREQDAIGEWSGVALVGDAPYVTRLGAWLILGDGRAEQILWEGSALTRLVSKRQRPGFSVAWSITPELA